MGLGDEIMALGRAEAIYEQTGKPVAICTAMGYPRHHDAWTGNPAVKATAKHKIIDGGGARPYVRHLVDRSNVYNLDYRARAGKVMLTEEEESFCEIRGAFAVVAPHIKNGASPNKSWGWHRWEKVIHKFPIPVYQLCQDDTAHVIKGAISLKTPTFRHALAVIKKAALVLCNEGGSHHMAASMHTQAVVVFGAFIPPSVTGYDFHRNLAVETEQGFCGRWYACEHCKNAMRQITPAMVKLEAMQIMESLYERQDIHRL